MHIIIIIVFIKLIYWGFRCRFTKNKNLSELIGTPLYIAPEVLKRSYNEKADLWSIGIMMYILLTGNAPFVIFYSQIIHISTNLIHFILKLLIFN